MKNKFVFYGSAIMVGLLIGFFVSSCEPKCDCTPECCEKCNVEQVQEVQDSTKTTSDTLGLEQPF